MALVLASSAAMALGEFMLLVVVNVLILTRTHSAPAVAALWIVPQGATLATGTQIGRLTDRWDKRRTLWVSNLVGCILVLGLLATSSVIAIYLVFGLFAVVDGAFRAAFNPYFRLLVPVSARLRANAINGALHSGALVVGPAIAGTLLLTGHPSLVIEVVAGSLGVSAILLQFVPRLNSDSNPSAVVPSGIRGWWTDLRGVFTFLRAHRVVAAIFVLFNVGIVFGGTADAQEVVFAHRALHLGSSGYGLLVSIAGVGYVLGATATWLFAKRVPMRGLVGIGAVGAALGYLGYALSPNFFWAATGLLGLGICQAAASTGFSAFIQSALPPQSMGHITSTARSLFAGLTILTTAGGGFLVGTLGVRIWMVSATSVMVLVAAILLAVCLGEPASGEFDRALTS